MESNLLIKEIIRGDDVDDFFVVNGDVDPEVTMIAFQIGPVLKTFEGPFTTPFSVHLDRTDTLNMSPGTHCVYVSVYRNYEKQTSNDYAKFVVHDTTVMC